MRKGFGKGGGREGMLFKKILSFMLFGVMTLPVLKERKKSFASGRSDSDHCCCL